MRFLAGDVDDNTNVTSIDAGRIQQYFVYGTAFDKASWSYWFADTWVSENPQNLGALQVAVVDAPVSDVDLYGMVTGDFNTSYTLPNPLKAMAANVMLRYDNTYELGANMEASLPVRMVNPAEVSALSLVFQLPTDLMQVTDVTLNANTGQFDWAVVGNELRIGWNASAATYFAAGETLVTIHLTTSESFVQGEAIRLVVTPDPVNELADATLSTIPDAELGIDVLEANALGIGDPSLINSLALRSAPNPFGAYTYLSYTLPADGHVTFEISNIYGMKVTTLVDDLQTAGNYRLKLDAADLPAGVYMATIRLNGNDLDRVQTIKLILNR